MMLLFAPVMPFKVKFMKLNGTDIFTYCLVSLSLLQLELRIRALNILKSNRNPGFQGPIKFVPETPSRLNRGHKAEFLVFCGVSSKILPEIL